MGGPAPDARRPLVDQLWLVGLAGFALGLLEYLLARLGPSAPAGTPGSGSPQLIAYLGFGCTVLLLPALFAALVARLAWPWRGRSLLLWGAALLPTAYVCVDQLAHSRHWGWAAVATGGWPHQWRIVAVAVLLALPVAAGLWWLAGPLARRRRAPAWLVLLPLVALPLQTLSGLRFPTSEAPSVEAPEGAPNILLLTVDTLRADELATYGGPGLATLDSLVASGVRTAGWAPSPWTLPSFATLFSAVGPTGHGAGPERGVDPQVEWWPERLRDAGWSTSAVVCNPYLGRRYGMARGFLRHEHAGELERLDPVGRTLWAEWLHRQWQQRLEPSLGEQLASRALDWLDGREARGERPWFLWVHLLDPHLPYHLRGEDGPWLDPLRPQLERGAFRHLEAVREGEVELGPAARDALRELYRGEARHADAQLRRVLHGARESSRERPLLWVLASDHGEEFFEHGGFEHGHALHGELLRVPLALGGLPSLPPGSFGGAMSLADIGPTLHGLLGLPPFGDGAAELVGDPGLLPWATGRDRSAQLGAAVPDRGEDAVAQLLQENLLYGPARTRWQWPSGRAGVRHDSRGELRFLQLDEDPAEARAHPDSLRPAEQQLLLQLDLWRERAAGRGADVHRLPQDEQQLRALGYIR